MKHFYLYMLLIVLVSCKKDKVLITNPSGMAYPVSFNVTDFSQSISPLEQGSKLKLAAVPPNIHTAYYLVYKLYNSNNTLNKTVKVRWDADNYGTFTDSLTNGSYTAVILGVQAGYGDTYINGAFYYSEPNKFRESFYKKIPFNINNSSFSADIALDRITSEIQPVIKDAIPANVKSITVKATGELSAFDILGDKPILGENPFSPKVTTTISIDDIGKTNFEPSPLPDIINTLSPMVVTITASDANGGIVAQKTIYNVTCQRNRRTILTGNLFSNSSNQEGFNIGFNSTFSTDTIKVRF